MPVRRPGRQSRRARARRRAASSSTAAMPTLWTAYLSGGATPRGDRLRPGRSGAGARAGVDSAPIEGKSGPIDAQSCWSASWRSVTWSWWAAGGGERGTTCSSGPAVSGVIERSRLGLVPGRDQTRDRHCYRAGYRAEEVEASGVCADSRWPGGCAGRGTCVVARPGTIWARSIDARRCGGLAVSVSPRGQPRQPPAVRAGRGALRLVGAAARPVLVEGVFDVHQLRAHGIENCAALGGLASGPKTFEQLARWGVEHVTLCLDRDGPGARRRHGRLRTQPAPGAARQSWWWIPSASRRRRIRMSWSARGAERRGRRGSRHGSAASPGGRPSFSTGSQPTRIRTLVAARLSGLVRGSGGSRRGLRWSRRTPFGSFRSGAATPPQRSSAPSVRASGNHRLGHGMHALRREG